MPLDDLIFLSEEESAPTILGDSESILLDLDFSVTGDDLHNQILDSMWLEVKGIPGVGSNLEVYNKNTNIIGSYHIKIRHFFKPIEPIV